MEEMVITNVDTETGVVEAETCENSNSGLVGLGVIGLIAGGATLLWMATKKRREARMIAKLRKKGYHIYDSDEVCDAESDCEEVE